ncbi:MAG: hypothetical protein ABEJ69_01975 [Candidatus Nanohaloarchaea archaeon]
MAAPETLRYIGTAVSAGFISIYAADSAYRFKESYEAGLEGDIEREGVPTSWEELGAMLGERRSD